MDPVLVRLLDRTSYGGPDLTAWQLAASSGHGWVWLWNYLIDNRAGFADQAITARCHRTGRTAADLIRGCLSRNRNFNVYGGILTPTATVAACLTRYLREVFGVTLPRSVIRCILDHYRGV